MNTRARRASAIGLILPFIMHLPIADGAITEPDRQHLSHLYSGIALDGSLPAVVARNVSRLRLRLGL